MIMNRLNFVRFHLCLTLFLLANFARAASPEWIWHDDHGAKAADGEVRYFRKTFDVEVRPSKATLSAVGDDAIQVYINGHRVIDAQGWDKATVVDVRKDLKVGENLIAIRGSNTTSEAAVAAMLEINLPKREKQVVVTDTSWVSSANEAQGWTNGENFDASHWTKTVSLGKMGVKPWGDVLTVPKATPVDGFTVLPGFKAELIRSAEVGEGSWVSMTIDQKGRLIVSPQQGTGNMLRITLSHNGQVEKVEKIDQPVGSAMGLLYAFDSLYVNGSGPQGLGLYRLHYDSHADRFDKTTLIKNIVDAQGEHGSHAVVLGPDKHIYIINGNFTKVPKDISPESQHRNFAEDQLLPRTEDGNGFGIGIKPPGGFILRTDKDGKNWELYCAGMRNTYDFAFNSDGEMVGFDSDMEYDWGMPWYRPIRFCHLVSGGDYGFREGSGKWPKYYPDSLPSIVDFGVGSPTGLKFGTDSNFPEKYKKALYALDWSYGRIIAVHLTPKGASYDGSFETFVHGKPLNVTDVEFGHDGAMYFTTGGRGTQSGLYRVSYVGEKTKPESGPTKSELREAKKARELRHELEAFHGKKDPKAIEFAWPHLDSSDRFIRYAARIAIECQPVEQWKNKALSETRTNAGITALLALARCSGHETQNELLQALAKFPLDNLSEAQQLEKLRVIELSFIRQGKPDPAMAKMAIEKLDRHYPANSQALNRELCELLIYLQAPDVVEKTLALLDKAQTQEEQIHYIVHLRKLNKGWTLAQREHYFNWFAREHEGKRGAHSPEMLKWFADAEREYADGSSYPKFIANFRKDAVETLTDDERAQLAPLIADRKSGDAKPAPVVRKFVQDWKVSDLEPLLGQLTKGRSFSKGRETFAAAQCVQCHRFGNEGGAVGPELTAIASRFGHRDILESIIDPSKVISEQFQNMTIMKKDGDDVTGRIVSEDDKKLVVVTDALKQTKVEVPKSEIQSQRASKVSPMPEGLMSTFTKEEILDLIAYVESGGKESAPAFQK